MNRRIKKKRKIQLLELEVEILKAYVMTLHDSFQELAKTQEDIVLGCEALRCIVEMNAQSTNNELDALRSKLSTIISEESDETDVLV